MRPIVTILSSEMDQTPLIRDFALARMLQSDFDVHLVGFSRSGEIWGPLAGEKDMDYRPFRVKNALQWWLEFPRILPAIEGDVIYAMKPRNTSLGLGFFARKRRHVPLALDIDDWEQGFLCQSIYWEMRLLRSSWFTDPLSPLYTRLLDHRVHRTEAITVTSSFLQNRYGGEWIPHTRDPRDFRPPAERPVREVARVVFLGTVRPHKGLVELLMAWSRLGRKDAQLHIVGTPPESRHLAELPLPLDGSVHFDGLVPFAEVPGRLAEADIVVIPQREEPSSRGQLPTKLIESMAMGCATISTAISDIPLWLKGCGIVVPTDNAAELAVALERLLDDPPLRHRLGDAARRRFLRFGSTDAVTPRLVELFHHLIARKPLPLPTLVEQALGDSSDAASQSEVVLASQDQGC